MKVQILTFMNYLWLVTGEDFISLNKIDSLVKTEMSLMQILDQYIQTREDELYQLKKLTNVLKKEAIVANADVTEFWSNAIQLFKAARRLGVDWTAARSLISDSRVQDEAMRKWGYIMRTMAYPSKDDLEEAGSSILRLQDVYDIDASTVAKGGLPIAYNNELTAAECYELGVYSYRQQKYHRSEQWMKEALNRYRIEKEERVEYVAKNKTNLRNSLEWKIYQYLPQSILLKGNKEGAFNLTKYIINNFSGDHEDAWHSQELISSMVKITNGCSTQRRHTVGDRCRYFQNDVETQANGNSNVFPQYLRDRYRSLCRGEITTPTSVFSKLKCHYLTTSPFTKFARLKEEEIFLKPRIVMFREAIHDTEIEDLKRIVTPKLKRGVVSNATTVRISSHRIVKQFSVDEDETELVGKIHRRTRDMSKMFTESAEKPSLINYGLGGHYVLHYDYAYKFVEGGIEEWDGNRLTSMLFYLTDVEEGGETAFPALNLTIRPAKGSVVMWRDLLYNGEGDERTLHAACPVTKGSKWVMTFFLHTGGNELRHPCKLGKHE